MEATQGIGRKIGRQPKSQKGSVSISTDKGYLRLRWTHQDNRHTLTLGLPEGKVNRTVAQQKARQIELDILSGNFDATLKKYKPESTRFRSPVTVLGLFDSFIDFKANRISNRTLDKYRAVVKHLRDFFKEERLADGLGVTGDRLWPGTEKFFEYLQAKVSPVSQRTYIQLLASAWDWGIAQGFAEINPWAGLSNRIKPAPKQPPKPFSREEIGAIIHWFRSNRCYSNYGDFVEFMFGTGCRTAEGIGLRWGHVADDCSSVWIGESLSRGVRKATKTNKARTISLTSRLQVMLQERRPARPKADDLVFTTPTGKPIDDHNFRNRAWAKCLEQLEIDYRKPYSTRHTLISHALNLGMNPMNVAQLTGHDPQVLFSNYAAEIGHSSLPDIGGFDPECTAWV